MGLLLAMILTATGAASAVPPTPLGQAGPAPWQYHGVVFGGGEWSSVNAPLGSAASDASLRAAVASGASAVRLIPTCASPRRGAPANCNHLIRDADCFL